MATVNSDSDDNSSNITFADLVNNIIEIFEPELCLTQEKFWRHLPRVIEEAIQIPDYLDEEWESIKILFKRMENFFQTHNEKYLGQSLHLVLTPLKKAMVSGFKMLFSQKLQEMLTNWYENCKDTLKAMEDLCVLSPLTTHTFTSTTIAPTQADHVDATLKRKSKKRKLINLEDAFADLADPEELETSTYPTGNVIKCK